MAPSSDPDADAVMASFDHPEAANDADAAAVLASFDKPAEPKSGKEVVKDLIHAKASKGIASIGGGLRQIGDLATGSSIAQADTRYQQYVKEHSFQPTDPTSQALIQANQQAESSPANPLTWPGRVLDVAGRGVNKLTRSTVAGPVTEGVVEGALPFLGMRSGASLAKNFDTQASLNAAAATGKQSMGAAAVAPQIAAASPELQAGFKQAAQKTGGAVNPTASTNHLEADQHGIQLMRGQATRDAAQFSNEQNSTHPDIVKRINKQNEQMTDALDNIRREAAPGAVQNNPIENGQTVVDALKAHDEPVQADIRAKYKALTDANGGSVPIDPGTLLMKVDTALKKNYLTNSVPPAASELLSSLRNGEPLDFEGFEAARSRLAEAQREGGSAGQAARIIRGELEQLPLAPAAAHLKGIADTARGAAKARFDALEADPAYQAAVDDVASGVKRGTPSPLADQFLDKYVLGKAPKANVDTLLGKLDPDAAEAVTSHTLNAIRKGAIPASGNITPTGFQAALDKYGPKLGSLVSPEVQESLESLQRVVRNAKTPPAGHFVNYSKSGVVMNAAKGVGQKIGEGVINAKTFGMGVPILKGIGENKFAKHALAPGAGLEDLPTKP